MILSGGRSVTAFGIQNALFSSMWTRDFSNDYGAVAPVMGRNTLLTVAFSTEWLPYNQFKNPNPSFANVKLLSIKPDDGTVLQTFDIPLREEYRSPPYSNIQIGDVLYLDCGWHVAAINSTSGAVIWESQPLARKNELKPLFMYSSSIIPAGDTLLYCLDTKMVALDRITGEFLWEYVLPEMPDEYYVGSEMRIVILDHIVIIAGLHEIHGVHAQSGEKMWVYSAPDPKLTIFSSPPILYAHTILIGRCDLDVDSARYAISGITPSTGTEVYREYIDFRLSGNPVIAENMLYCWNDDSLLQVSLYS
ncbi:MAG: PQQ-like beta-propeller repeat protein [Methanospirillum sp.]|uniref:outer membrane protein assembly factor BamB family protein n=1 Tax=Methanospirillum sp. TaxID=45200 RepID=UPI0023740A40|nr:PQQ-binding-like beta-propeller repeat protein [Methanospirillum sp.]MDD1730344.1 PQQ-like beta-propeller repeat protein [Methanospirillum sp.]